MKITLDYGETGLEISLPDEADTTIVEPQHVAGVPDPFEAVRAALRRPVGSPPLRECVRPGDAIAIAFCDITRATPDHIMIPVLLEELEAAGVARDRVTLFNATGTHRSNSDEELRAKLGDEAVDTCRIIQNDARDAGSHVPVGTTSSGNDIRLHRAFVESDVRIVTGFIEPHFFAGFSGAGKLVMPGLAHLDTVMRNHSARHIDSPDATWGVTRGNPIWEEIHEAASFAAPTFLLHVAQNRRKQITAVFAGDWQTAHERGCAFVRETAMAAVDAPFDIVITSNSGYPLDQNLYQAVKGMSAAAQVVKPGGGIIAAAECRDGIPDHGPYGKLLRDAGSLEDLLATVRHPDFQMGDSWQVQIQALICLKADVYVRSDGLDDKQIEDAMLNPCSSIEALVDELLEKHGPGARICVLPEGPQTIPYIRRAASVTGG